MRRWASFHKGSTKLSSASLSSRAKCRARIHRHAAERKGRTQFIMHGSQMRERERKKHKIEFWPGGELRWQILKLHTLFFQFISKGALLARNKEALTAKANTIWANADSRDGNEAVIMSISPSVSRIILLICVSLSLCQALDPSVSSCRNSCHSSLSFFCNFPLFLFLHLVSQCFVYPSISHVILSLIIFFLFLFPSFTCSSPASPPSPPALIST